MQQDSLGLAVVGAGVIFGNHAFAAAQLAPRLRMVGVADLDQQKLTRAGKEHFAPVITSDYQKLLRRTDVDIVAVCTPPSTHEEIVCAALDAGKYVVCEKPLAHSLAAADRIVAVAAAHPGRLGMVYQHRFSPEARRMVWLRDNGHLGQIRYAHMMRFGRLPQPAPQWWGQWAVSGGGVAITQFIHELDLLYHLMGRPVGVMAKMDTYRAAIESEDTISATIEFDAGAMATCASTVVAFEMQQGWDLFGTRASVHYPWAYRTSDLQDRSKAIPVLNHEFPLLPRRSLRVRAKDLMVRKLRAIAGRPGRRQGRSHVLHTNYYKGVLDAILAGDGMPVAPEDALVSQELCTAIYASASLGQPVGFPLDRSLPQCTEVAYHAHAGT